MAAQDDSTAPGRRRRGRRGNREGSIYLTTDGRWRGSILLPDGIRKYLRGKTRAEVQQKIRRSLDEVDRRGKLSSSPQKSLLRDYLPAWLEQAKPGLRHGTGLSYEQHIRLHILPALGHLRLEELEPAHVSSMLARSQAAGVSATTALRIRATLRRALNDAMRSGYLARNAAALAVAPKAEPPVPVWLDAAQAEAFLAAALGDPAGDFLALLLFLGLRSGEGHGLKWTDIDEERGTVAIRRSLQRREGQRYEQPPKTRQSERTLPLTAQAREILDRQRERQLDQRDLAGDGWQEQGYIWTQPNGNPRGDTWARMKLHKITAALDLPNIRLHDLRHSTASILLERGVPARVVADLLGHSTIAITLNTYSHVTTRLVQGAVDIMDSLGPRPSAAGTVENQVSVSTDAKTDATGLKAQGDNPHKT